MKKFENLGKSLDKSEQRNTTGGMTPNDLYCQYKHSSYVFIAGYSSIGDCYAALSVACNGTPQPYACYCTPYNVPAICNL